MTQNRNCFFSQDVVNQLLGTVLCFAKFSTLIFVFAYCAQVCLCVSMQPIELQEKITCVWKNE